MDKVIISLHILNSLLLGSLIFFPFFLPIVLHRFQHFIGKTCLYLENLILTVLNSGYMQIYSHHW